MNVVILDSYALAEGDLNWSALHTFAQIDSVKAYARTAPQDIIPRLREADFAIVNKANINEAVLCACPRLQWVGVTATGVDSLDTAACRRYGVTVANVPGYSTHSVAQLTFALLLSLCQSPARYDAVVRGGSWQTDIPAHCGILPQHELYGKTLGLIGFGAIAQQVACIARAFGMKILCHTRTVPKTAPSEVPETAFVSLDMLLSHSDIISLHCPSTPATRGLINARSLALCKEGALLLNTARGLLVDEQAVADALHSGRLGGFAADVVSKEPIDPQNPLLHTPRTLLTPHIAWATPEALARLSDIVCGNLASFLAGTPQNVIN